MLIHNLHIQNLLSFGDKGIDLPLQPLNVLVGPNGSGKSNVLEVLGLLRELPKDLENPFRSGGGFREWVWAGKGFEQEVILDAVVEIGHLTRTLVQHTIGLKDLAGPLVTRESIKAVKGAKHYYSNSGGKSNPIIFAHNEGRELPRRSLKFTNSIIAQLIDPLQYYTLSQLTYSYEDIRLYREWTFGRQTIFRQPQRADQRKDFLAEDLSNLGLFLNKLGRTPATKRALITALQDLYEGLDGYEVIVEGGTVQVFFTEGDFSIPATRLSDGTLRYLALLALLLDPTPPPLIGLEEPELGLHPDLIPKVADLLIAASERTQLVVTTHSDILIDALSEQPESVLVCEKHEGQTHIERLNRESLADWLKRYRLGELWIRGELGGTRW